MSRRINQQDFQTALKASFNTGEYRFARELLNQWLEKYPNDLEAQYFQAKLHILHRDERKGNAILGEILEKDPENLDCIQLLRRNGSGDIKYYSSVIFVHTGEAEHINAIYPWATTLRAIRKEIRKRNYGHAEKLLSSAISESPENILVALEHARLFENIKDNVTSRHILEIYTKRWPDCLQFKLLLASNLFTSHDESEAVAILHSCARSDPGGLTARRLFGSNHTFLSIFPQDREIDFVGEIPTGIAIDFKWTKLPSGQFLDKKNISFADSSTAQQDQSSQDLENSSFNEKIYVILTSYIGLKEKYGPRTTEVILNELKALSNAIEKNPRWKPMVFIPDLAESALNIGIQPIDAIDPWKIKLSIMDLNALINKSNQTIGAVLIVGSHDVVPFHRLPNPAEDSDKDVFSDNPYATSTSNYLLPEWIVGRLPGEMGNDPGLLLEQIRHITGFHATAQYSSGFFENIRQIKRRIRNFGRFLRELINPPNDFGYSAEVWRRSSIAAFRPIGKGADLRVSPPFASDTIDSGKLLQAKCVYFNLHGLATTNEWYGQRDFSESPLGPDFPVAIKTDQIRNITNNIDLVFTEACYGGYINDKHIEDSIALKLLSIGSQGVVGSSCISYGSVFTPLIGADLLAFIFWKYIKDGYSFGSALRQAKIGLIKVMMQRQGYLDGEDQKTILSFNLYGDPLGSLEEIIYIEKNQEEYLQESDLSLMNDSDGIAQSGLQNHQAIAKDINEMLESYVPGLETAKMRVRKQKVKLAKIIGENQYEKIGSNLSFKDITQIVYEKTITVRDQDHQQYARLTIDDQGKIVKLAMSR